MRTISICWIALFLPLALLLTSCHPSAEAKRKAILDKFQKRMEHIDASVPLGMAYSNVVATIGQPFSIQTNDGCVYTIYHYEPKVRYFPLITDGFEINFSNDVVFRKLPIEGRSE